VAALLGERISSFSRVINVVDALGLGAYAAVGAQKSLDAGLSAPAAALVGVVNACAGGVLRDLLTREEPLLFKPGQFYVLAAALGSALYTAMVFEGLAAPTAAAWICVVVTFVFRALAIRYDWKTSALRAP
jgi:uncharacterized membrane protein YeiH